MRDSDVCRVPCLWIDGILDLFFCLFSRSHSSKVLYESSEVDEDQIHHHGMQGETLVYDGAEVR
jgi:hypothetical protein